jgi:RNA polymerase sigma-70 factor (ECF subfamily)
MLPQFSSWRRDAAFSTWLFAVATNLYRREVRRIPPRTVSLEDIITPKVQSNLDSSLIDADRRRAVRNALQELPAKVSRRVAAFYFHEHDVAATASSLGLPEGTVKARLSRGRTLLGRKLRGML